MENPTDLWLVEIDGQQYEADTDTVKQWILDGYVTAQTRVQKGSLRPIEAGRAPAFRALFSGADPSATLPTDPYLPVEPPATSSGAGWQSPSTSWQEPSGSQWDQPSGASWQQPQTGSGASWPQPAGGGTVWDGGGSADSAWPAASGTMYGGAEPTGPAYGSSPAPAFGAPGAHGGVCVTHAGVPAKFLCQGCRASLCGACVKRYSNTAVCTLCGQLCKPYQEATAQLRKTADRYSGFGLADFAAAIVYPFKDPIAVILAGLLYGIVLLFGWYGTALGAGLMFGYVSNTIRRVARGRYEDGPAPDLSDPIDLIWDAVKTGTAVLLISFGPMIALILFGLGNLPSFVDEEGGISLAALGAFLVPFVLTVLWAVFYYPMALLVAGYTNDFVSTINPLVGIVTMWKMGFVYVKAYVMCLLIYVAGSVISGVLGLIEPIAETGGAIAKGIGFLAGTILQSMVMFFASMIMAAILGLAVYKRADELDVYIQ